MVGLINAVTMSVLERTREIGILRCTVARARDIRRIFTAEGIAVSLAGWLLGSPIGYALARAFNWLLLEVIGIEFGFRPPAAESADRARRHRRARATDHAHPAPARRALQAA
jgi:ABC-type antimicrobial peptide transport system permease subunit